MFEPDDSRAVYASTMTVMRPTKRQTAKYTVADARCSTTKNRRLPSTYSSGIFFFSGHPLCYSGRPLHSDGETLNDKRTRGPLLAGIRLVYHTEATSSTMEVMWTVGS
jgi:hypothetical protein